MTILIGIATIFIYAFLYAAVAKRELRRPALQAIAWILLEIPFFAVVIAAAASQCSKS